MSDSEISDEHARIQKQYSTTPRKRTINDIDFEGFYAFFLYIYKYANKNSLIDHIRSSVRSPVYMFVLFGRRADQNQIWRDDSLGPEDFEFNVVPKTLLT